MSSDWDDEEAFRKLDEQRDFYKVPKPPEVKDAKEKTRKGRE